MIAGFGQSRIFTHAALVLFSAVGCYLTHLYVPRAEANYVFTIGFGYVSLFLIALTLAIGPLMLLRQRRNPVNIHLRRDAGIWGGITGCLHVIFGLQIRNGGDIAAYFFRYTENGYEVLLNAFGTANYIGLVATVILVLLLATSNDLSLRQLKGRRWKSLQRLNYALVVLAILHTLVYQMVSSREQPFVDLVAALAMALLIIQILGVRRYQSQSLRSRKF